MYIVQEIDYFQIIPRPKTAMGERAFNTDASAKEWNSIPKELRKIKSLHSFKNKVFNSFLKFDKNEHICTISQFGITEIHVHIGIKCKIHET